MPLLMLYACALLCHFVNILMCFMVSFWDAVVVTIIVMHSVFFGSPLNSESVNFHCSVHHHTVDVLMDVKQFTLNQTPIYCNVQAG